MKDQIGNFGAKLNELEQRLEEVYGRRKADLEVARTKLNLIALRDLLDPNHGGEEWTAERLEELGQPIMDDTPKPDFIEKQWARRELQVLLRMRQLEDDHKVRDVLALSFKHENKLLDEGELDNEKISLDTATSDEWFPEYQTWYPASYTLVIGVTGLMMLIAFPGYFKAPVKFTLLGLLVGVIGFVAWVALIELDRRYFHVGQWLSPGGRDAFNPFKELASNKTWMWQFMAIRFTGLVLIVPFIEEFFLRGWLMRYIDDPDWDEVPLGTAGSLAILGVIGYGVLSHIGEPLAAAVWFGMVTWLYLRTKSIWDCVLAHSVTNLLLGIFVCYTGKWYLW